MTLKQARHRRKLTQVELAEKSGVTQQAISSIERGDVENPSWDTVARLCQALNVEPEDIFPVAIHKAS